METNDIAHSSIIKQWLTYPLYNIYKLLFTLTSFALRPLDAQEFILHLKSFFFKWLSRSLMSFKSNSNLFIYLFVSKC